MPVMEDAELKKLVHECYALHFLYMNLGISPDDIYIAAPWVANVYPPGRQALIQLKQGDKTFNYTFGPVKDEKQFLDAWEAFVNSRQELGEEELDRIVYTSDTWHQKVIIMSAVQLKGIRFPLGKADQLKGSDNGCA